MLNHIAIMGNLVAAPEMKATAAGVKVASFRIACERDYAPQGAQRETDFVDCVAWREKAEFVCRHFTKANKSEPYLPGWRWVRILLFLRAISSRPQEAEKAE